MRYLPGAALALLMSVAVAGCGQPSEPPRQEATPVVVYQVRPDTIRDQIILSGTAAPWQHVTLSAEIGGKVVEVARRGDESDSDSRREIREGDRVSAGELIFGIDTATLEADLRAAEASAEYARQNY